MFVEDAWHARHQVFFKCLLCPLNGKQPKNNTWVSGPDDKEAHLVFFSTFKELKLPATGPMDHATTKLFGQSPILILSVGPCDLMLGTVPLFPLFLKANATPTIPHSCDTSTAARSSLEQHMQLQRMVEGEVTQGP